MTDMTSSVHEDLNYCSARISDITRTIAASVIALVWLLLIGGESAPNLARQPPSSWIVFSGISALLSLLADYLQYVFGWNLSNRTLKKIDEDVGVNKNKPYDEKSPLYLAREWAFVLKQWLVGVSVVVLVFLLGYSIFPTC